MTKPFYKLNKDKKPILWPCSYADGSQREEGHEPGDCVCKEGYAGAKCTECAKGFHDYPKVSPSGLPSLGFSVVSFL